MQNVLLWVLVPKFSFSKTFSLALYYSGLLINSNDAAPVACSQSLPPTITMILPIHTPNVDDNTITGLHRHGHEGPFGVIRAWVRELMCHFGARQSHWSFSNRGVSVVTRLNIAIQSWANCSLSILVASRWLDQLERCSGQNYSVVRILHFPVEQHELTYW